MNFIGKDEAKRLDEESGRCACGHYIRDHCLRGHICVKCECEIPYNPNFQGDSE